MESTNIQNLQFNRELFSSTIVITNRKFCLNDHCFIEQIKRISSLSPKAIILREKDLSDNEYLILAEQVMNICSNSNVDFFVHGRTHLLKELNCHNIHFPGSILYDASFSANDPGNSHITIAANQVSISCHSLADIERAEILGAAFVTLGNIFETGCKLGLAGKGLDFLTEACKHSNLPIYAIGGISPSNLPLILSTGAAGGCMMSWFMKY